jgi:hypothetical protein
MNFPTSLRKFVFIASLVGSGLTLVGCSQNGPDTQATVILHNSSKQSFNLWVGHRDAATTDLVEVGGQNGTSVTLKTIKESEDAVPAWTEQIKVNAKRPGGEIQTTQEIYPKGTISNPTIIINWDGKNFSQQ